MRPISKQSPENPQPTFNVQRQTRGADHCLLKADQDPCRRTGDMTTPISSNPHLGGELFFGAEEAAGNLARLIPRGQLLAPPTDDRREISSFRDEHLLCRA
jgi:hypothetical protein